MSDSWARDEMEAVNLEDRRLNERLVEALSRLGAKPNASIPAACGGHAEMTAAYRLFDNEKCAFERIIDAHAQATRKRVAAQKTVVLAQDTTEADLSRPEQEVAGAGPLDGGKRRGMFLHVLHAFCEDGTPLGTLHAKGWARPERACGQMTSRERCKKLPIEQKESYRWLEAIRQAQEEARRFPETRMICVGDSESDVYDVLEQASRGPENFSWIVRACKDRLLEESAGHAARSVRELALAAPILFANTINVRGRKSKVSCDKRSRRQPRESRQATIEVRAVSGVALTTARKRPGQTPLTVNIVFAREINPPKGETPVEWLLLTTLPVDAADQTREVMRLYSVRWMIEIFFRVLKTGCRVEDRRFETLERFTACLAVYLVVAWRTLYVCRLGRACPQINCEAIFDPSEWKAVWTISRRTALPANPPTLGEMTLLVAELGGYIPRKNSPPGPQTIWIGLQRTCDFAHCWTTFGPGANKQSQDV